MTWYDYKWVVWGEAEVEQKHGKNHLTVPATALFAGWQPRIASVRALAGWAKGDRAVLDRTQSRRSEVWRRET